MNHESRINPEARWQSCRDVALDGRVDGHVVQQPAGRNCLGFHGGRTSPNEGLGGPWPEVLGGALVAVAAVAAVSAHPAAEVMLRR